MKRIIGIATIVGSIFSIPAMAEYTGPLKTAATTVTVKEAKTMNDDAAVSLQGNIVGQLREEHYLFRDKTGTIDVEIESYLFNGITVGQDTPVTLYGELEREKGSVGVEVYRLDVTGPKK